MLEEKKVRKQKLWLEPDFADTDANVFETAQGCVLGSNTSTEQGGGSSSRSHPQEREKGTVESPPVIFL